jgi:hypothetical protein
MNSPSSAIVGNNKTIASQRSSSSNRVTGPRLGEPA